MDYQEAEQQRELINKMSPEERQAMAMEIMTRRGWGQSMLQDLETLMDAYGEALRDSAANPESVIAHPAIEDPAAEAIALALWFEEPDIRKNYLKINQDEEVAKSMFTASFWCGLEVGLRFMEKKMEELRG